MRQFGLILVATLIACGSAIAAWKAYPQPQLGFIVEFPADPTISTGRYRTVLVQSATAHIFSVKENQALYVTTVVDLPDSKEEGASLLGEAEFCGLENRAAQHPEAGASKRQSPEYYSNELPHRI